MAKSMSPIQYHLLLSKDLEIGFTIQNLRPEARITPKPTISASKEKQKKLVILKILSIVLKSNFNEMPPKSKARKDLLLPDETLSAPLEWFEQYSSWPNYKTRMAPAFRQSNLPLWMRSEIKQMSSKHNSFF